MLLDRVVEKLGAAIQHTKSLLDTSTRTLGHVHKEVLPAAEVPATAQGFSDVLGPGSSTMSAFERDLTVRGSETTLKLLLANGMTAEYEAALSDFPRKPDGRPLALRGVAENAARLAKVSICTMERRAAAMPKSRRDRSESVSHN